MFDESPESARPVVVHPETAAIEQRVVERLEATGLDYELVPCDPALAETETFCASYGYALADSANTIVVIGKSEPPVFAACILLANTRLDVNHVVKQRLGTKRASFARAEETRQQTGMMIGGVTPFGLPPDLPIWVDARVFERQRLVLGGGSRSVKVLGPPDLLRTIEHLEVVEGLAYEAAPPETDPEVAAILAQLDQAETTGPAPGEPAGDAPAGDADAPDDPA